MNVNALNADLSVAAFVVQKLIRQKDVKPINSQPKNNITILPEATKNNILITKDNIKSRNLSTKGSYLKYENAYINTKRAIVVVNNIKENDIVSIKK